MMYCRLENGVIVEGPRLLPTSTETVSGFNLLSNQELKPLGWLPHRFVGQDTQNQNIIQIGSTTEIFEDEVVTTIQYRDMTEQEIAEMKAQVIKVEWDSILRKRSELLLESDWTQLPGNGLSDQDRLSWKTYRQGLLNVTDYDSPGSVVWPQKPTEGIGVATL